MTTGLSIILLGWFGAARSTIVEEQIPYLISGGLLGVALATIGALTLFAHWLTVLVRENRRQELDPQAGAHRADGSARAAHRRPRPEGGLEWQRPWPCSRCAT